MIKLEFHPMLKDVPLMPLHERDALGADIAENGQVLPIITWQGLIIDGRNRYLACISRGVKPNVVELTKPNAKSFVASLNYFRKHWTTKERSHFAALMSLASEAGIQNVKDSTPLIAPNGAVDEPVITQPEAAKQMGVSRRSVQRAKAKIKGKSKPAKSPAKKTEEPSVDYNLTPIPAPALPYWNRKSEAQGILKQISELRTQVKKLMPDDPMWSNVNLNGVIADLNSAFNRFTAAIPEFVCPYCKGEKPEDCKCCKGKGVVSKFVWKQIPDDVKPKPEIPF
jgi:ParB-like chromosome segregation protein Spo0J